VSGSATHTACAGAPSGDRGSAALARYRPGGGLDTSFGSDGKVTALFLGTDRAAAHYDDINLMEGGNIAATGAAHDVAHHRFLVIVGEYVRSGNLNKAFSGDGRAKARGPYDVSMGSGLAVNPDGRPLVAGSTFGSRHRSRFLVARFRA
jgi:hypothetical protein